MCRVFSSLFSTFFFLNAENHLLQCLLHMTEYILLSYIRQKKNKFVIFHHMIHPCWTLSAAGSFLLHLLSLFSPHILNGWHFPPYAVISRVKSPPDTLAYLSSAAQTSKSARASHRDGEVPPGSRHILQSSRRSPGMKHPFRYVEQGEATSRIQFIYLQ